MHDLAEGTLQHKLKFALHPCLDPVRGRLLHERGDFQTLPAGKVTAHLWAAWASIAVLGSYKSRKTS